MHCYVSPTVQLKISHLFKHRQLINISISNKSVCHKSFVCIQFSCLTCLLELLIGPYQLLPLQARVDLGVIAMKSTPHPQITAASPSDGSVSYLGHSFGVCNLSSSIKQVLATTPHETPTIRTLAPHHKNYTSSTNQTRGTLLEKQGRAHKRCTPVDPHSWMCKCGTTSTNLHTAAMWGHGL